LRSSEGWIYLIIQRAVSNPLMIEHQLPASAQTITPMIVMMMTRESTIIESVIIIYIDTLATTVAQPILLLN